MPTDSMVEVGPAELAQIVGEVFETMLRLPLTPCEEAWSPRTDRLSASVHLTGDWSGAVVVECSYTQACRFAGRFLSQDPPLEVDDVVRDVAGELANMIGGNLKCILLPGIRISMPSVVNGDHYILRACGPHVEHTVAFECEEGIFWVRAVKQFGNEGA